VTSLPMTTQAQRQCRKPDVDAACPTSTPHAQRRRCNPKFNAASPTSTGKLSVDAKVIEGRVANDEVEGAVTLSQSRIVCNLVVLYVNSVKYIYMF